ncbi:MAG: tRNA (adenosine(37)-N6)-threonylcarbamoyltransferase complex transferase subunit TsaD [Patescibacteria group bacterium]|mgnify:CR=1 FL=1
MKILGIETSCDETAVCLIEADGAFDASFQYNVLGNALLSQIAVHAPYGGVFPNLAKREHSRNLVPLLKAVLEQSFGNHKSQETNSKQTPSDKIQNIKTILEREPELFEQLVDFLKTCKKPEVDAIAVTRGPGLEPALWVGVNFARALSSVWNIPIVPVNHLEGHIAMAAMDMNGSVDYSNVLKNIGITGWLRSFEFPAISLLISGGHTELNLVEEWPHFKTIGETRDDAVGEAFDKVARMMGLPYPGGPEISRLAAEARQAEIQSGEKLPRPMIHESNFDFSFSGLKTAVLRLIKNKTLTEGEKLALAREFEDAAADVLVSKTIRAVEEYGAQTVIVGGGVSANTHIKSELKKALDKLGVALLYPPSGFETDNALMIALAGYFHALNKEFADPAKLVANGNLRLGSAS